MTTEPRDLEAGRAERAAILQEFMDTADPAPDPTPGWAILERAAAIMEARDGMSAMEAIDAAAAEEPDGLFSWAECERRALHAWATVHLLTDTTGPVGLRRTAEIAREAGL